VTESARAATPAQRPARLAVGAIGAGRVGAVLTAALARAGHRAVAVTAVSDASRGRVERLLDGVQVLAADEVAAQVDLLLLTVPDDVLEGLVAGLADTGAVRPGTLVAHTSGVHGSAVLDPLTRGGALPLALHPAMTFTGTEVDLARLAGACFGVTSPDPLRLAAEALVVEMGAEPVWIAEEARPLYHAALAIGANHLVTLIAQSAQLLAAAGAEHPGRVLGPLLSAAVDNALRHGDRALTGPVARGDAGTVRRHLDALPSDELRDAYVAVSRLTALRALSAGVLAPDRAEALLDVLADPTGAR
jgi:predicted short-subunit dehydrogenase-like oxidoreductase (DUF2520 family)